MVDVLDLQEILKSINKKKKHEVEQFKANLDNATKKINKNITTCVNMCNNVINKICSTVVDDFPNDMFLVTYAKTLNEISKNRPTEIILTFIKYIYTIRNYRENLLAGNESFFMEENYGNAKADQIFQFKKSWGIMKCDTKEFIKKAMKTLIGISEQFIKYNAEQEDINKMYKILLNE